MLKALILQILVAATPIHLSMTSIEHVPDSDSLKVMIRMNYDLFLRDYQTIDDDRDLHLLYSYNPFPADYANNYINSKLFIHLNNKRLTGKLLSMDIKDSEISIKMLYYSVKKPKNITVRNTILTGLYSDQVNLTIIKVNDFEKGIRLTPEQKEVKVKLN